MGGGPRGAAGRVRGGGYGGVEVAARVWGERRRRWRREREALRLFFLDCSDYIAPLLIVLGRVVS